MKVPKTYDGFYLEYSTSIKPRLVKAGIPEDIAWDAWLSVFHQWELPMNDSALWAWGYELDDGPPDGFPGKCKWELFSKTASKLFEELDTDKVLVYYSW